MDRLYGAFDARSFALQYGPYLPVVSKRRSKVLGYSPESL